MAPPQATPYPLWPLSLVCHLLVWPVMDTVYTWSWDQTSDGQGYHCISCGSNWNTYHRKWSSCGHTAPQYLSDIWSTLSPSPIIRNLVLPILTRSPFPYTLFLQSYSDSVMMNRSFANRFSYGHPVLNSCERACWTVMECRGLKQKLWWTPTFSLNSSLRSQPTHTLHLAFSYMLCKRCTSHSSMPSLRRAHQMARLGTRSNALPRSTMAMWCLAKAPSLLGTYM